MNAQYYLRDVVAPRAVYVSDPDFSARDYGHLSYAAAVKADQVLGSWADLPPEAKRVWRIGNARGAAADTGEPDRKWKPILHEYFGPECPGFERAVAIDCFGRGR